MEDNKIKVSLGTVLCLLIIVILLCVIVGMWYYYTHINNNNKQDELLKNNTTNAIEEKTNKKNDVEKNQTNHEEQKDNSKNIIMYEGTNIANSKPGVYYFEYEEKEYENFYNTMYSVYQNGKKVGETKGTVKKAFSEMFDANYYYIDYENEFKNGDSIFVSSNYNVFPRNYENVTNIPEKIKKEFIGCKSLKMQSIDLDGDGKKEYIVIYSQLVSEPRNEYDYETDENGIYLYDSDYNRVSLIAAQKSIELHQFLSDFDYIKYIDIDNDNNMEIIVHIPTGVSCIRYGIYKYEENSVKGQIDSNFGIG